MNDPTGQKFHWVTNGEPHAIRRREILSKYGSEVRKLYGYDHQTAWVVSTVNNPASTPLASPLKSPSFHFFNKHISLIAD